ncbi:MAG: serine hydrolase domain-containing protein [Acetobacteraceae bacterium]|nr:beta-lactamase family protein [Pseudomonadota bacterium]
MRYLVWMVLAAWCAIAVLPAPARADDKAVTAQLQRLIDTYVKERTAIEGISGIALRVDRGSGKPVMALFSGTDGRQPSRPIGPRTLFQIGSNTKHFTAALILRLEADGILNIDQTLGQWLPQYTAWSNVTIRSLLNMTAPIPTYSETVSIGTIVATELNHQFALSDLVAAVDPGNGQKFPLPTGWFYSNTNNILAAMIIEAATQQPFQDVLQAKLLRPLNLQDTYYARGAYPEAVLARVPRGLYQNQACLEYQPKPCSKPTLGPLIGKDVSRENLSWAGPAGAIIASPGDLERWIRALFSGKVLPQKQLDEMQTLVSRKTGKPIGDVSADDPAGFGLDLGRLYDPATGEAFWFYEGETLGFRAFFVFWPQYDLVITAFTNSQPPEGEDKFGQQVISGTFRILQQAGAIQRRK